VTADSSPLFFGQLRFQSGKAFRKPWTGPQSAVGHSIDEIRHLLAQFLQPAFLS
jgi:hypothetical protein